MTAFIFTIAFIALVAYSLQRNHAKQGYPHVAGSGNSEPANPLQPWESHRTGGATT